MVKTELELIDSVATAAMQAMLSKYPGDTHFDQNKFAAIARAAYTMAEAMFGERCAMIAEFENELRAAKGGWRPK